MHKGQIAALVFTLFVWCLPGYGQQTGDRQTPDLERLHAYEDTLAILGYAVVNDSTPEKRFLACRELILKLKSALRAENSFQYPFERLHSVSIQYPQDSSFRIFTWQLYVDVDDYRYYGAIQLNTPDLVLIPLIDRSYQIEGNLEQMSLAPEQWYGAVYYNLREVDAPSGKYYLLFGFDGYKFYQKRKVVDVLRIHDGKATFGAPVFYQEAADGQVITRQRLLLEYSSSATVRLNFDPTYDMILFDHLTEGGGLYGEGLTYYPDGTYEGYRLEKGRWVYVEKVFNQTMDEAPRDFPILDKRKKNLFGKDQR